MRMCYADELIPMHIPDGYLSPATCAALYATSAPFWYVALRRLKRLLPQGLFRCFQCLPHFPSW